MFLLSPWLCVAVILLALAIDIYVGEPRHFHPLVIFGKAVSVIEHRLWTDDPVARWRGVGAVCIVLVAILLPAIVLQLWLFSFQLGQLLVAGIAVYVCIGLRSLREHAEAVAEPLREGDLPTAREQVARIVSRDTGDMNETEIATAVCESVLENGNDAVFAAIFWFLIAGIPGVLLYRAANTLDAMWGYKNTRYRDFGWAAARLDDGMNWIPARLVAFSYALVGNFPSAMQCWSQQAARWKSPNAGPVMAAGAGALQVCLGGGASYGGEYQQRPALGCGRQATATDIVSAMVLVDRTLVLWLSVISVLALVHVIG